MSTAIELASEQGLTMVVSPAEAQRRLQELQAFVQSAMVSEVDYGVIPGTKKPSLYQPGAQKMAEIYGFGHRFIPAESVKDWQNGFFYFEYRCQLFLRRDGRELAEGIGSCNSRESKYAILWTFERDVPKGIDKSSLKKKELTSKNGKPFTMYAIPNPDPYSLVNTIQKMAAKRAYIHAVIAATRSSGLLTQDVEDLPPEAFGKADDARSWEHDPQTGELDDIDKPVPYVPTNVVLGGDVNGRQSSVASSVNVVDPKLAMLERFAFHEAALVKSQTINDLRVAWDAVCDDGKRERISLTQKAQLQDQKNSRGRALKLIEKELADARKAADDRALEMPPEGQDPLELRGGI